LIGGKTLNALPHNPYSTASQELIEYLYSYYHTNNIKQASFFASNNFALSKEQFCKLGGFDISLTVASEDREFCDRWLAAGYPMIYAPEVNVYHAHDLTLASFWRQHFNYGRGAFNFQQVRTKRKVEPIKIEPSSFYLNLFSYPFSKTIEQPKLLVSSLFFLSQLAGATGFFWERFNQSFGLKYAQ
jgi:GT2 family glycosyltransferase